MPPTDNQMTLGPPEGFGMATMMTSDDWARVSDRMMMLLMILMIMLMMGVITKLCVVREEERECVWGYWDIRPLAPSSQKGDR